jgi:serine phosphatase RsbU (regulator of sigma subunit)
VIDFATDDVFLMISDGITEAKNKQKEEFGENRLMDVLHKFGHTNSEFIRDKVLESVRLFCGENEQFDDMTVVVIKIK